MRESQDIARAQPLLPYGAKGLEFEDWALHILSDKVVVIRKSTDDHFTIHAGFNSGIIDVHRTWNDPQGRVRHETVFQMRRADLPRLLADFDAIPLDFRRLIRRLKLGWLHHNRIGILPGALPTDAASVERVTTHNRRRKRLAFDQKRFLEHVFVPEFLEDVWDFADGPFLLVKERHVIGIGLKSTDQTGIPRLFWIKSKDLNRLVSEAGRLLPALLSRYAISPASYD